MNLKKLKRIPTWVHLRGLGTNRALKSSYYWFVFVPIAAHLIRQLPAQITTNLFGTTHTIALGLPFSWYVFYFAAVAFALASLLFAVGCPRIIQSFQSFSDFYQQGYGVHTLAGLLFEANDRFADQALRTRTAKVFYVALRDSNRREPPKLPVPLTIDDFRNYVSDHLYNLRREELPDVYAAVVEANDLRKPKLRYTIAILYLLGFGLTAVILLQNLAYVVQLLIR